MSFLQFFVWGAWLITVGNYWFWHKRLVLNLGGIFNSGIASIIMPALTGIIADRWINAEKLYGILHILSGFAIFYIPS
jgi:NHS family xanthosine MFS transporter